MWRISERRLAVLIPAVIVASLAGVTLTPAQPTDKKLPKPVVVNGKGKAKPRDFQAQQRNLGKVIPAHRVEKIDFKKIQGPQRLTQADKLSLLKSVLPILKKTFPTLTVEKADMGGSTFTLNPRTQWIDQKGYFDFSSCQGSILQDDPSFMGFRIIESGAIDLFFNCSQAGTYLITFNLGFLQGGPLTIAVNCFSGSTSGPSQCIYNQTGPCTVPIFYTVTDTNLPWQHVQIQGNGPEGQWLFYSVDVQYVGQKK